MLANRKMHWDCTNLVVKFEIFDTLLRLSHAEGYDDTERFWNTLELRIRVLVFMLIKVSVKEHTRHCCQQVVD